MRVLDRDPMVNLPPACTDATTGTYSAWAYYVPHTATTMAGVEIPLFASGYGWDALDAIDGANKGVNANREPLNRVGAVVLARHCNNGHGGEGYRLELQRTLIIADEGDVRSLGPVRPNYNYQTATSFEPGAEPDDAQPLFLPFSRGSTFPDLVVPVSYGERRFLVAHSSSAILIRRRMLELN